MPFFLMIINAIIARPDRLAVIRRVTASFFLIAVLAGCATVNSLPEVDLSAPGWKVYNGQVRWKPKADKTTVAGELIAARHANGDVLINFSKPPFSIFTAQSAGDLWHIEFVERGRSYSGRGRPPKQFVWFLLPDLLGGAAAPQGWQMSTNADGSRLLKNRKTGEELFMVID